MKAMVTVNVGLVASALFVLLDAFASADTVCPKPTLEPPSGRPHKEKRCPDFKDTKDSEFCCPSTVERGHYFCCNQETIDKLAAEEAKKIWNEFLQNYFALIVIGALVSSCVLILVLTVICRRNKACPFYHDRTRMIPRPVQANPMYRPVDTIPPKVYEAPPPYESSFGGDQGRNDWNCILENEVNDGRPRIPPPIV